MGQPQPHPYTHNTVDNKSTLLLIIFETMREKVKMLFGNLSTKAEVRIKVRTSSAIMESRFWHSKGPAHAKPQPSVT